MALDVIDTLTQELVLVLSAIVMVFWLFYTLIIHRQLRAGIARNDWWISMIFYVGIVLLVLSNMILAAVELSGTPQGLQYYAIAEIISMLVFIYGFYLRMKSVVDSKDLNPTGP